MFRSSMVQRALEQVLFTYGMRHPATGYVQGMNDVAMPFFAVFYGQALREAGRPDAFHCSADDPDKHIPKARALQAESDCYWCLCAMLEGFVDLFTEGQPGLQKLVAQLRELGKRIDGPLVTHVEAQGIRLMQVANRWMNCLLLREIPPAVAPRLFDTYIAEAAAEAAAAAGEDEEETASGGAGGRVGGVDGGSSGSFRALHVYVCAALLVRWKDRLAGQRMDVLMKFFQALPTKDWGEKEVEELLAQAYIYKVTFGATEAHFREEGGSAAASGKKGTS